MRIRIFLLCAAALVAAPAGHPAFAQVQNNVVVTPRIMSPDTPRLRSASPDQTVASCAKVKQRKRSGNAETDDRSVCQQDQK